MTTENDARTPLSDRPWLSAYADGVPHEIEPVTETLVGMLEASVARYGDRVALEFFGERTTYAELGDQVSRAANALRKLGVEAGDRVALVLPNCPQHVVAFYAALRIGAIVVEHNPLYTPRELRHQFEVHEAVVAIVWDKVADIVADFPRDIAPAAIVAVDLTDAMPWTTRAALRLPLARARESRAVLTATPTAKGVIGWAPFARARRLSRKHPSPVLDDIALLQLTSGTTGTPKAAILSHRNLRSNAAQGRAWVPGLREGEETFYAVLPMFHAYGLTLCLTFAMSIGARVVLFPKFDVDLVVAAAKKSPPTFLPGVPPIYDALSRATTRKGVDLSSIRFAISGAMSLPVATVARWEEATGGLLVEGYGMTETSPVALGNPIGHTRRPGTVGVPSRAPRSASSTPTIRRATVRSASRASCSSAARKSSRVLEAPDETAAVLLEGGWLRTGDIVTVSEDGFVTVIDRVKELIITGGFNVSPTEVEQVLTQHPDVTAAAVVGLPRSSGGEDVVAAVVMNDGAVFDSDALRDFCRGHLAAYKVPKRIVEVDDLPRSQIGKVLRRSVREQLLSR